MARAITVNTEVSGKPATGSSAVPTMDNIPGSAANLFTLNGNDLEAIFSLARVVVAASRLSAQRRIAEKEEYPVGPVGLDTTPSEVASSTAIYETGQPVPGSAGTIIREEGALGVRVAGGEAYVINDRGEAVPEEDSIATAFDIGDGTMTASDGIVPDDGGVAIAFDDDSGVVATAWSYRSDPHLGRVPVVVPVAIHDSYIPNIWHTLDGTIVKASLYDLILRGMSFDTAKLFMLIVELLSMYDDTTSALVAMETGFAVRMDALVEEEELFRQHNMDETVFVETFADGGEPGMSVNVTVTPGRLELGMSTTNTLPVEALGVETDADTETPGLSRPVREYASSATVEKNSLRNISNSIPYVMQKSRITNAQVLISPSIKVSDLIELDLDDYYEVISYRDKADLPITTGIESHRSMEALSVTFILKIPEDTEVNALQLRVSPNTPPRRLSVRRSDATLIGLQEGIVGNDSGVYEVLLSKVVDRGENLMLQVEMPDLARVVPMSFNGAVTITSYRGTRALRGEVEWTWPFKVYPDPRKVYPPDPRKET